MFTLNPAPEFEAQVDIPIAGAPAEPVTFIFKHKTRDAFDALATAIGTGEKTLDDACRDVVVGWKVANVEFSDEALTCCFQNHAGSAGAIWYGFRAALIGGQRKN